MRKKVGLFVCLWATTFSSLAAWVKVESIASATIFYDPKSLAVKDGIASVPVLFDFSGPAEAGKLGSSSSRYDFDCRTMQLRISTVRDFQGRMGTRPLGPEVANPGGAAWSAAGGSFNLKLAQLVCNSPHVVAEKAVTPERANVSITTPSEGAARKHFEDRLRTAGNASVEMKAFRKTNALAMEKAGIKFYQLEWEATLVILQRCWFNTTTLKTARLPPGHMDGILLASNGYKEFQADHRIVLSGNTLYQRAELGWRVVNN